MPVPVSTKLPPLAARVVAGNPCYGARFGGEFTEL